MGLFSFLHPSGDSGNSGHGTNPPPTQPPPVSNASLRAGVYLNPWMENSTTLATLADLRPNVVRINYPAFPLMVHNVDAQEADRLVVLIEAEITRARSIGALPLIVTTLGATAPATEAQVFASRDDVAAYYAGVAKRYPGCAWEIGNEAEMRSGGGDAPLLVTTYAAVFGAHAVAIRAADPTATLVTAGTSGFAVIWIRAVLALTTPDAVGVHPYGVAPQDYARAVAQIGTKLPVYFTEWGLENISPQGVFNYFDFARGVTPVAVLFCLSDRSAEFGSIAGNQPFGLMDVDAVRRPSYAAAKTAFAHRG